MPFSPVIGRQTPPFDPSAPSTGSFTPAAVATVLPDGETLRANAAFSQMNATVRSEAVTRALASGRDEGFIASLEVFYMRGIRDGVTTVAFVDASGFLRTMEKTGASVALVFAGVVGAVALLAHLLSRRIAQPVQEAWDQQAEFVADASHELKTPLTVILANANILEAAQDQLAPEQRRWVQGIGEEARHMKQLVEELLFLARSDEGAAGTGAGGDAVDFSDLVRQACLSFDAVAFETGVELRESVDPGVSIKGDRAQLERLVRSLLDNAIKYAGAGGSVDVALRVRKKGRAVFSVTNSGAAIAPEDLPRVFDRFWRCDQARSRSQNTGFGLGLAIAKSIAEAHGGRIEAASSPEDGTTFTVTF